MKNKFIIITGIILLTLIVVFVVILGGSNDKNIVTPEQELITGITCKVSNEDSITYDLDLLTNNVQFDYAIKIRNYTEIKINHTKDFESQGFAFMVKSPDDTNITFNLKLNDELIKSANVTLKSMKVADVNLVMENSISVKDTDNLIIEVVSDNAKFMLDSLLIFNSED